MSTERIHSLDALRAFALLLGVVFHAVLAYMLPPGDWAVGTTEPALFPQLFAFYSHSFRMEIFFLLAGFFASLALAKRPLRSFVRDRAIRIVLVFVVALYPMKWMLNALWLIGGMHTGRLTLSPEAAALPLWHLVLRESFDQRWPEIGLTHLWFLYYLAIVTALFLLFRALVARLIRADGALTRGMHAAFHRVAGSIWAPVALTALVLPMLGLMDGPTIDTPDQGFVWHLPVLALYGLFFALGALLYCQSGLLSVFGRRWKIFLPSSMVVALFAVSAVAYRLSGAPSAIEHADALRWLAALGTGLTMSLAVLGWLGLFVRVFEQPRPWVRYLADSAYWVYIVHLPVVVALQIALADSALFWWIKWLIVNLVAFPLLLGSYHVFVRRTWVGAWLNGRARRVDAALQS